MNYSNIDTYATSIVVDDDKGEINFDFDMD